MTHRRDQRSEESEARPETAVQQSDFPNPLEDTADVAPEPILPGTRLDIGKPVEVAAGNWICVAKLLGCKYDLPWLGGGRKPVPGADEVTRTVFVVQGRGRSAAAAERDALRALEAACRPPETVVRTITEPPPSGFIIKGAPKCGNGKKGIVAWFKRLIRAS